MNSKIAVTAVSMLAFVTCAQAQRTPAEDGAKNYPTRPIRVIVPQAPGGSNDIMARYIGGQLSERLGKQVVIDEVLDKNLLGGFVAEIGSLNVDGSLDGQLARLRERLARG